MSFTTEVLKARPRYENVDGAPVLIGQHVTVRSAGEHLDDRLVGMSGVVEYLEFDCGCGQQYPGDPMIGVLLSDGTQEEFWAEELGLQPERTTP